jgi:hypothetical protein
MADLSVTTSNQYPLKLIGALFWTWYRDRQSDTWPVKVWFITANVKLSQLHGLWVWIFGPEPQEVV